MGRWRREKRGVSLKRETDLEILRPSPFWKLHLWYLSWDCEIWEWDNAALWNTVQNTINLPILIYSRVNCTFGIGETKMVLQCCIRKLLCSQVHLAWRISSSSLFFPVKIRFFSFPPSSFTKYLVASEEGRIVFWQTPGLGVELDRAESECCPIVLQPGQGVSPGSSMCLSSSLQGRVVKGPSEDGRRWCT